MTRTVIISISSDIGRALAHHYVDKKEEVVGTFRTHSKELDSLDCELIACDLNDTDSVNSALLKLSKPWDRLILAAGTMEPIAPFEKIDFPDWQKGIETNLLVPLQIVHTLLPFRRAHARILFFAGAGTNGPAPRYSCYALSKIALIKMCEQLACEIPDCTFSILGPGWVKTKIHEETIQAKQDAGSNYERTQKQLEQGDLVSMERVIECCEWLLNADREAVNGRNFSLVHDKWRSSELLTALKRDPHLHKLRRRQDHDFTSSMVNSEDMRTNGD